MARLPTVSGDNNTWGTVLNTFLSQALTPGGYLSTISVQTSNYSPAATPGETVLVNATSGNITITLPTAASNGNFYAVKKVDSSSNTVTINTTSSQTIDGGTSAVLKIQYASITVVSDGSNWNIV
jgi:hypothetical protein